LFSLPLPRSGPEKADAPVDSNTTITIKQYLDKTPFSLFVDSNHGKNVTKKIASLFYRSISRRLMAPKSLNHRGEKTEFFHQLQAINRKNQTVFNATLDCKQPKPLEVHDIPQHRRKIDS